MKRVVHLVVTITVLLVPFVTFADEEDGVEISLSAGVGYPTGDFGRAVNQGFVASASVGYSLSRRLTLGVGALGDYGQFAAKNVEMGDGIETNADMSLLGGSTYISYTFGTDSTRLYLLSTVGVMSFKATGSTIDNGIEIEVSESETRLYAAEGLGLEFMIGDKTGLFVQGMFNIGFEEDDRIIWLTTQAGVRFRL
jgi:hypothetical protein